MKQIVFGKGNMDLAKRKITFVNKHRVLSEQTMNIHEGVRLSEIEKCRHIPKIKDIHGLFVF